MLLVSVCVFAAGSGGSYLSLHTKCRTHSFSVFALTAAPADSSSLHLTLSTDRTNPGSTSQRNCIFLPPSSFNILKYNLNLCMLNVLMPTILRQNTTHLHLELECFSTSAVHLYMSCETGSSAAFTSAWPTGLLDLKGKVIFKVYLIEKLNVVLINIH